MLPESEKVFAVFCFCSHLMCHAIADAYEHVAKLARIPFGGRRSCSVLPSAGGFD